MNIAIIPARGGSKRIPRKNEKIFAGKPIIAYSIQAAIDTQVFDRIIVSTDDEAIAKLTISYGAEAPFIRPKELSDDHTPTAPVIEHALAWCRHNNITAEFACCIYATAPFLKPEFLQAGLHEIKQSKSSSAYSVTAFSFPILRGLHINESGNLRMLWPENELTRSQDLPKSYHDAGQFYWLNCDKFNKEARLYNDDSRPVILPKKYVQDIDTHEDWEIAEAMYSALGLDK